MRVEHLFSLAKGCFVAVAALMSTPLLVAQSLGQPEQAITKAINEANLVTLTNNTRPEAVSANDRGPVADDFELDHLLLQLKRSPERELALESYIEQLHDSSSLNFHHWLSAAQFGADFGVANADVEKVSAWLASHGFTVHGSQASGMVIDFSGTASMIREAFHTEIHNLDVNGAAHFANMSDPQIPEALSPVVAGVVSMHNFHPRAMLLPHANYTYTNPSGTFYALVPGDIAKIYNFSPLFAQGISGQGQTIMVVEDTYLYSAADWSTFRNTLGLSSYKSGSLSQTSPQGAISCSNPGFQGKKSDPGYGDDSEAAIDVEWASAGAPSAAIVLAACTDTNTTFGGLIALENVINGPERNLPSVVSISYGESEASNGAAANAAYFFAYQQAVAEGVSVFVSSGDEGAASSDDGNVATHGITVSGFTSTPYNVSVGGTDFGFTADNVPASTYWSATNAADYSSALSYIQEVPWNDSCAGGLVAGFVGITPLGLCNNAEVTSSSGALNFLLNAIGGSGGPSSCAYGNPSISGVVSGSCAGYAKPAYQKGLLGNPSDGVRDIPDVSLFASNGFWGSYYVTCWSDPNTDPVVGGGFTCTGAPSTWAGFGGTSVSSPIMASIQALVNQKTRQQWGNPNPVYYALADAEYLGFEGLCNSNTVNKESNPCVFYDVTQGDNDVVCQGLTMKKSSTLHNCYLPSADTYGVLSTSNLSDQPAYTSHAGWDFATGIGTVNAFNLVTSWPLSGQF
jgi:subtilase family serine protease